MIERTYCALTRESDVMDGGVESRHAAGPGKQAKAGRRLAGRNLDARRRSSALPVHHIALDYRMNRRPCRPAPVHTGRRKRWHALPDEFPATGVQARRLEPI